MTSGFLRDFAMYAAIFGFFAMVWFGWAQENPPKKWRVFLALGSILGIILAIVGGILAWQHWQNGSVLAAPGGMTTYYITVGIEFALAALGAGILAWKKWSRFIALWIVFVVGVHFIALAPVFKDPSLYVLAVMLAAVAPISLAISQKTKITPSAICGSLAGSVLLVYAAIGLVQALARL